MNGTLNMWETTPTTPHLSGIVSKSGSLEDAFKLKAEINSIRETITGLTHEAAELQKIHDTIIGDYFLQNVTQEGRFTTTRIISTRRSVNNNLVKKLYPDVWNKIKRVTESCTLADLEKHLSGVDADTLCDRKDTITFEVDFDWKQKSAPDS